MNTRLTLEKLYDEVLRNTDSGVETYHLYELIQITSTLWENRDDNWTSLTGWSGELNEIVHTEHLTHNQYVINLSYHWRITKNMRNLNKSFQVIKERDKKIKILW